MYISLIQNINEGSSTSVRRNCGITENFNDRVGTYQCLALNPYLFSVVKNEVTNDIQDEARWCMKIADDIILIKESLEDVNSWLKE